MKIGESAPYFECQSFDGKSYKLEDFKGKKVWLAFFRYASCPLCNLQVMRMIQNFDWIKEANIQIIAVFQSPAEHIEHYVGKTRPPFPLIADPEEKLYKTYGVRKGWWAMLKPMVVIRLVQAMIKGIMPGKIDGSFTRIPGDFLIDENQKLVKIYHGKDIGDHVSWDTVLEFTKS